MFEGWLRVFVFLRIAVYAENLAARLFGCFYWFRDKHRADRVTFEVSARCKCRPQLRVDGSLVATAGRSRTEPYGTQPITSAVTCHARTIC